MYGKIQTIMEEREKLSPKESVVFLLYKDGKVLLEKRTNKISDAYNGMLIVPGGKIEQKDYSQPDYFFTALLREVEEELSVKPLRVIHLFDNPHNFTPRGNIYYSRVYLVTEWEGETKSQEPEKATAVWVNIDEAANLMPLEFSKEIIAAAIKSLPHPAQ